MRGEGHSSLVTEDLRKLIGSESEAAYFHVERGAIRKILRALQDDDPMWRSLDSAGIGTEVAVPPSYFMSIIPKGLDVRVDVSLRRRVAGGEEWRFFAPLRLKIGDTICARRRIADIFEKQGKAGPMLFIVSEDEFCLPSGEQVALHRSTQIRY